LPFITKNNTVFYVTIHIDIMNIQRHCQQLLYEVVATFTWCVFVLYFAPFVEVNCGFSRNICCCKLSVLFGNIEVDVCSVASGETARTQGCRLR